MYNLLAVAVMCISTYALRALPLTLIRKKITSRFLQSILYYIPYAVLSALTFPAIFFSTGSVLTATIGTAIALLLSFFKINMAVVAVIAVVAVFGLGYVM